MAAKMFRQDPDPAAYIINWPSDPDRIRNSGLHIRIRTDPKHCCKLKEFCLHKLEPTVFTGDSPSFEHMREF